LEKRTEVTPLCEGGGWTRTLVADNVRRVIEKVTKDGRKNVDEVQETGFSLGTSLSGVSLARLKTVRKLPYRKCVLVLRSHQEVHVRNVQRGKHHP
jgi:hypothetical protein